ncbi:MAG TPA: T9SS type A sorting domain-containing protein [Bacteroidia bacterium]|nr:T9SS type A sorting domain-containing protein [Bacteroidia bacterium]
MKKQLLLLLIAFVFPVFVWAQCTTTNATACECKDPGQTDCDLLPDIQVGHPPFYDLGATYGVIEYSQTGHGVDNGRLKVSVSTPNPGFGPLEIHATNVFICGTDTFVGTAPSICPDGITYPGILVNQRIYHKSGNAMTYYDRPAGTMTYHPTHSHMHVDNWGNYTLRTRDSTKTNPLDWPMIGYGTKLAFCVMDYGTCSGWADHCLDTAGNSLNSNSDFPNYGLGGGNYSCSNSVQGISSGYLDIYWTSLDGMWIDIPPGTCNGDYWIVTEVDPNNFFLESDETNNVYAAPYTVTQQVPNPATQTAKVQVSNSKLNLCQGESTTLTADNNVIGATYLWSNGDTTASTTVNSNGIYSVELITPCGVGQSYSVEVNVFNQPAMPNTVNDTIPTPGTALLSASGAGDIKWYDAIVGGNLVGTGNSFITPSINTTTTFYAETEEVHNGLSFQIGPADSSVSSGTSSTTNQYLEFDVYNTLILHSVKVYAQTAGTRTIELSDNSGTVLQSALVNVNAGMTIVDLDFLINPGTGYRLSRTGGELFRNNNASGLSFPYTIDNFCSITGTSQGNGYYYFFYDWSVVLPSNSCVSQRSPAIAVVASPNSIADVNKLNALKVYPNPANNSLNVSFTLEGANAITLELIDATGRVVRSKNISSGSGTYNEYFDLSSMSRGVYSVHVLSNNKNYYHKLIVQ